MSVVCGTLKSFPIGRKVHVTYWKDIYFYLWNMVICNIDIKSWWMCSMCATSRMTDITRKSQYGLELKCHLAVNEWQLKVAYTSNSKLQHLPPKHLKEKVAYNWQLKVIEKDKSFEFLLSVFILLDVFSCYQGDSSTKNR